jgi:hypothetical protein
MRLLLLLGALALSGCSMSPKSFKSYQPLFERFRLAVAPLRTAGSSYQILDVATVTDFAWDSVYYFTGYQSERDISRAVGAPWQGPAVADHGTRLLFARAGQVVTFVDFPSFVFVDRTEPMCFRLYSCDPAQRKVYSRAAARFAVFRICSKYGLQYPLVPVTCLDKDTSWRRFLTNGCSPTIIKALADSAEAK